MMIFS